MTTQDSLDSRMNGLPLRSKLLEPLKSAAQEELRSETSVQAAREGRDSDPVIGATGALTPAGAVSPAGAVATVTIGSRSGEGDTRSGLKSW